MVQEKDIVLTGVRMRSGTIWAYTAKPQSITGEHLILTSDGVSRSTPQALQQRLQQQQGQ
jgi:hypothetical protein